MSQEMQALVSILEELDDEHLVILFDLAQAMKRRQDENAKLAGQESLIDAQKAFQDLMSRRIKLNVPDNDKEAIRAYWTERYETSD